MKKTRLFFLIKEYRLAQDRLNKLQSGLFKLNAGNEVREVLEKELKEEILRATKAKDEKVASLYKQATDKYFPQDPDRPSDEDAKRVQGVKSEEAQSLAVYYEAKLRAIRKLLGIRNVELLDIYDEKAMFIGGGNTGSRLFDEIEEEEENNANKKDPGDFTFGKM
jgi:hypothetical protein